MLDPEARALPSADSAAANRAAVVSQACRNLGEPGPAFQSLI